MTSDTPRPDATDTKAAAPGPRVFEHLFGRRTVLLFGEIKSEVAHAVCSELLALSALGADPIRLMIHSPGGHVESADTIFDTIRFIEPEVFILGTGWVASAGALIFVSVPQQRRFALPNTRFMLHQPLGGVGGPASDVEIEASQVMRMRERLNRTFAEGCQQPIDKIRKDTDRNHWLSAEEAIDYGLLGRVVHTIDEWAV